MLHKFFTYLSKHQVILGLFLIALAWFIFQIREILITVFISYIIISAVLPLVGFLRKKGLPKILAVLVPYLLIVSAILLLIIPLVQFASSQITSLVANFPKYLDQSASTLGFALDHKQLESYFDGQLTTLSKNAFSLTTKIFGGVFSIITIFIVSFYWLMYHDDFKKAVAKLFAPRLRGHVLKTLDNINEKLGAWMRGQIFLCFFIGLMSWIALTLIGIPSELVLPLALVAGILEAVPTLGPILSAIPATIVALTISPAMALIVVLAYIIIQALENNILVPNVMQKAVGLNPVIVILSITVGASLMGIAGALLAIPFVSLIIVILQTLEEEKDI